MYDVRTALMKEQEEMKLMRKPRSDKQYKSMTIAQARVSLQGYGSYEDVPDDSVIGK